jgi:hypothetical protein
MTIMITCQACKMGTAKPRTELQIGVCFGMGARQTSRYGLNCLQPPRPLFPWKDSPSSPGTERAEMRYQPRCGPKGVQESQVSSTYLKAPTPKPPIALPITRSLNLRAPHCKAEPTQKTTDRRFDAVRIEDEYIDIPAPHRG